MGHSLDKFWSRDQQSVSAPPEKKAGKPGWEWTPTQERQLFRLVAKGNVPWKHIPTVMHEDAAPGKKEFAPCLGACRDRWKKMTDMNPTDTHIRNKFDKEKQRKQLEQAFERYQQRQLEEKLTSTPSLSQSIPPQRPSRLTASLDFPFHSQHSITTKHLRGSSERPSNDLADNASPPPLMLEAPTPADSIQSISTPTMNELFNFDFSPVEMKELNTSISSPGGLDHEEDLEIIQTGSTKRPAPSDFSEHTNASLRRGSSGRLVASAQEELAWAQQDLSLSQSHRLGRSSPLVPITCLTPVQEESKKTATSGTTVDDVEDEMKAPRGFVGFIKWGLTKSRLSITSMVSSARSSRQSFSEFKLPEDSTPFHYDSYMSSRRLTPSARQTTQYQGGRTETSIFLELRLAGASDNDVAARLKKLLRDIGPEKARILTNIRNITGETALEVSLALGNVPACEALLEAGADVHARTSDGKSLSEFGRKALSEASEASEANNNAQYVAIGTCRNVILSYANPRKSKKAKKATAVDKRFKSQAKLVSEAGSRSTHIDRDHNNSVVTAASSSVSSALTEEFKQGTVGQHSSDETTTQASNKGSMHYIDDRIVSKTTAATSPLRNSTSNHHTHRVIPSQQPPIPSVPELVAFFDGSSAGWQPTPILPPPPPPPPLATSTQNLRPNTMIWNSYFTNSPDLPAITSLGGGSATLDMSAIAGNTHHAPGNVPMQVPPTGHYELLPDGRMAYIVSLNNASQGTPSAQGIRFSRREARVVDMGDSIQLRVPSIQPNPYRQIVPENSCERHGSQSNNTHYLDFTNEFNETAHPNTVLPQPPHIQNPGFSMENGPLDPVPPLVPHETGAAHLLGQRAISSNDTIIFQPDNFMCGFPDQRINLSSMDIEALSFGSMSNMPQNLSTYSSNFVPYWDSYPENL